MFARDDWTLFRSLATLGQRAGVPTSLIPRLVAKELTDNALDAAGSCQVGWVDGGFFIEDHGPGLPGDDDAIASFFSIARLLTSSKLLRLPTRGALGNGLRVITGAVLATGGSLSVTTGGRRLDLVPQDSGETRVDRVEPCERAGTRVEVRLGELSLHGALTWAERAISLAGAGDGYRGLSSPWWYDDDAFFELCQAAGDRTARDLVGQLDGCTGSRAGKIAAAFRGRLACELDRPEAAMLLTASRAEARPVRADRLGRIGRIGHLPAGYAHDSGEFSVGGVRGGATASIPFVVEVWAEPAERAQAFVHVNRTPITVEPSCWFEKSTTTIAVGDTWIEVPTGRRPGRFWLNVQAPHLPITSDGKAPDFEPIAEVAAEVAAGTRIGEIERGTVDFSISRLSRLAKALDVPVWRVLERAEHLRPTAELLGEQRARALRLLQRLAPADLDLIVRVLQRLTPRDEGK